MLQTMGFFRASVLNSSYSAFQLALASPKNVDFANRIISAKSENAHSRLAKLHSKDTDYYYTLLKVRQYGSFLDKIDYIKAMESARYYPGYYSAAMGLSCEGKYILNNDVY
ncbi:hypothetical protein [Klebsiella sp. BIGb0407]|uniref:hypothetical protein n=1 Tax=Klebsiella sp. BIGb0407 TaxID=2940603 RepID=UPI0021682777|nr:hypothetical protein [Klebsiella sp. BIGb0407]MCS3432994.1 hypothetical protein [Klebsiella sp. BIGb0407]